MKEELKEEDLFEDKIDQDIIKNSERMRNSSDNSIYSADILKSSLRKDSPFLKHKTEKFFNKV